MIRIGILGAAGRMGKMLVQASENNPNTRLQVAVDREGSSLIGVDAGELVGIDRLNVKISDNLEDIIDQIDVLIDFSLPESTVKAVKLCQQHKIAMVIGTTGLTEEQNEVVYSASQKISIVYAGNYSTGVNVSLKLIELAAKAFGSEADIEVLEAHHKHKIDAPSGTAYMMAEAAANARNQNLAEVAVYGREGQTGAREDGTIGIHAIRGGEIIGDHTVMLIADGEIVEITHKARERMTFASGAVKAANWVAQKNQSNNFGLFDMQDVLNLKS